MKKIDVVATRDQKVNAITVFRRKNPKIYAAVYNCPNKKGH
jgi:hypothetical protein